MIDWLIGTGMDSPTRTTCWPMASAARLQPARLTLRASQYWHRTDIRVDKVKTMHLLLYYYYYTCIYNVCTFSSDTESEALAVTRWTAW